MNHRTWWYVVAESDELPAGGVLGRQVLGEWLAVWRTVDGVLGAAQDRCLHRAGRLSCGRVDTTGLRCGYHGWTYAPDGAVAAIPAEGPVTPRRPGRLTTFEVCEHQGYVFVRLERPAGDDTTPFTLPHWGDPTYRTVRVQNVMANNVTNCVENFIDVPHTVDVHPGIFRKARGQQLRMTVRREAGEVCATLYGETDNLGWFARFLNPTGAPIEHSDRFIVPNVTHVDYRTGRHRHLMITSHSVPIDEHTTRVYTDLTFHFGPFTRLAGPIVRYQGQRVIDQDIVALRRQGEVIRRYGNDFQHSPCDVVHVFVEQLRAELDAGRDPRLLPPKSTEVSLWV